MSKEKTIKIGNLNIIIYFLWKAWTIGFELPNKYNLFSICILPLSISFDWIKKEKY